MKDFWNKLFKFIVENRNTPNTFFIYNESKIELEVAKELAKTMHELTQLENALEKETDYARLLKKENTELSSELADIQCMLEDMGVYPDFETIEEEDLLMNGLPKSDEELLN